MLKFSQRYASTSVIFALTAGALSCISGCASPAYSNLSADLQANGALNLGATAELRRIRHAEAKFCATLAHELQKRAYVNQFWAVGITGTGVAETAAGSGAGLVAAQMAENSGKKKDVLQVGAILTAAGLASLGVAAIFDWNGLAKNEKIASAHMAEASTKILSATSEPEADKWWATCTDTAVKVGEDVPDVKNPNGNPPAPEHADGEGQHAVPRPGGG